MLKESESWEMHSEEDLTSQVKTEKQPDCREDSALREGTSSKEAT